MQSTGQEPPHDRPTVEVDVHLEPDESVWAVVEGRDGGCLVGTDRRLLALGPPTDEGRRTTAWPYDTLDDLRVLPDSILVCSRDDHRHLATVPTRVDLGEETLQAITVIELLIARAIRSIGHSNLPPAPTRGGAAPSVGIDREA